MSRPKPDHRGRAVFAAARSKKTYPGDHAFETALFRLIKGDKDVSADVREAYEIYNRERHRHVLDAAIFGKATNDQISEALEMAPSMLTVYRHLFCDRNVFPHSLVIPDYVAKLPIEDEYKEWYSIAYTQGPAALLRKFKIGDPCPLSPDEIMQGVAVDQYHRFLTHRGEQITSAVANAAFQWGKEAARTASLILQRGDLPGVGGNEEMRIALRVTDETKTAEQSGLQPEDLVTE